MIQVFCWCSTHGTIGKPLHTCNMCDLLHLTVLVGFKLGTFGSETCSLHSQVIPKRTQIMPIMQEFGSIQEKVPFGYLTVQLASSAETHASKVCCIPFYLIIYLYKFSLNIQFKGCDIDANLILFIGQITLIKCQVYLVHL